MDSYMNSLGDEKDVILDIGTPLLLDMETNEPVPPPTAETATVVAADPVWEPGPGSLLDRRIESVLHIIATIVLIAIKIWDVHAISSSPRDKLILDFLLCNHFSSWLGPMIWALVRHNNFRLNLVRGRILIWLLGFPFAYLFGLLLALPSPYPAPSP